METENQLEKTDKAIISQKEIAIYQGQFPHPDILKGFSEIIPDMPERILKMAEAHNEADIKTKNRNSLSLILGQVFTFLIMIIGLVFGVVLAKMNMPGVSIASIVGGLAPILISGIESFKSKK